MVLLTRARKYSDGRGDARWFPTVTDTTCLLESWDQTFQLFGNFLSMYFTAGYLPLFVIIDSWDFDIQFTVCTGNKWLFKS